MNKHAWKRTILLGVGSVLLLAAAFWYTAVYNDSRLLVPMDFSTYVFQLRDLPMILAMALFTAYILYLVVLLVRVTLRSRKQDASRTRAIRPQLGFLGFFGFLGFGGFWTYAFNGAIFPFVFFMFFGFFGFFYEGKLSNTFMDERYRENQRRAQLAASRTALSIIFLATLLLGKGRLLGSLEYTLIAYVIVVTLALALEMFLAEYLLYHYDHDDPVGESEG